jgi:diguanylate cyclase (GGDEF)-like protein
MTEIDPGFHAAIGMASQKDYFSLTHYMLNLLDGVDFVRHAMLHEVQDDAVEGGDLQPARLFRRFIDDPTQRKKVQEYQGFLQCVQKKGPLDTRLENGLTRLLFFIRSSTGPMRLISVEGASFTPQQRVYLMNLVTLYEQQVQLLDDKERDALTCLFNRQSFDLRMIRVLEQDRHAANHSWLACFDIDHFKRVNDTYGHLFGDEVLLHFAQLMKRTFRYTDFLFRFGGEEFVVLFSEATNDGIHSALERFRNAVADYAFPIANQVTVSIGYTPLCPNTLPTTLLDRADQALYHAKKSGRNQVVSYDSMEKKLQDQTSEVELF